MDSDNEEKQNNFEPQSSSLKNKLSSSFSSGWGLLKNYSSSGYSKTKEYSSSVVGKIKGIELPNIMNLMSSSKNKYSELISEIKDAPDLFTTRCDIPFFIFPAGKSTNSYKVFANFSEYESASRNSYKIPIPHIVIYGAHSIESYEKKIFQETIIKAFTDYFHRSMKKLNEDYIEAKKVEKEIADPKQKNSLVAKWLPTIGAVGVIAIATNPIIDLLFLLVALTGGYEAISELVHKIRGDIANRFSSKLSKSDKAFEKDEEELKAKEILVRQAISKTKLIIHPGLVALQKIIQEEPKDIDKNQKIQIIESRPSLLSYLTSGAYISSMPQPLKEILIGSSDNE
ncbi:MAG: hypothetical protein IEMM0002_0021 [bacterium]|nr:MAG: hypothetical protein IEMM0002_0021 [bacterium]